MGKNRKPPAKRKKPKANVGIAMDGGTMGEGGMLTPTRRRKRRK